MSAPRQASYIRYDWIEFKRGQEAQKWWLHNNQYTVKDVESELYSIEAWSRRPQGVNTAIKAMTDHNWVYYGVSFPKDSGEMIVYQLTAVTGGYNPNLKRPTSDNVVQGGGTPGGDAARTLQENGFIEEQAVAYTPETAPRAYNLGFIVGALVLAGAFGYLLWRKN
jgi:hypothetical protein